MPDSTAGTLGVPARSGLARSRRDLHNAFDWVMERAGSVRGASVCDIGCGPGRFTDGLARRGAGRVVGIDVAPEMLRRARRLVRESGVGHLCEFHHADILDWIPEEEFDLTIAVGFWDHVAEPAGRLAVIRKMTRGRFLSAWPRFWTWRMPLRTLHLALGGSAQHFYRRPELYTLLESANFRVERCDVVGNRFCVEATPV